MTPRQGDALTAWVREQLPHLAFEAQGMTWDAFLDKAREMGAIVEAFIEGDEKRSPSVQFRIDPFGYVEPVSTHDQVLDGQVFLGCRFPADEAYRLAIQDEGTKVAAAAGRTRRAGTFRRRFRIRAARRHAGATTASS